MGRLNGKSAIVTGRGTGIGHATCHRFGEEGAKVMILNVAEEQGHKT